MIPKLMVKYASPEIEAQAPLKYAKSGDCGLDLANASGKQILLLPNAKELIPAGIQVKIPEGYCGLIIPRSSAFVKKGLTIITGLIDSGYTGPLYSVVWNSGLLSVTVDPWERLSQMMVFPVPQMEIESVQELPVTERGATGFGSTG